MPLPKHCSPFARRLLLSERESADLAGSARALVDAAAADYEQFLWRQHGTVSAAQWTLARDKDDVRLYEARRAGSHTSQELLAVGALHGELDDALFGALSTSTEALRLRAAYTKGRLSNGAVLAALEQPTRSEPFRALTVQWLVTGEPLHVRALASGKKSDVVALEATGVRTLSNGETVGFLLLHSVELAQAPPLPQYERAGVSLCAFWRQSADDRVQLYARATVSARDKSHAARAARATSGSLLCLARSVHCGQMKKLAWLLRTKAAQLGRRPPPFRSFTGATDAHRSSSSSSSSADRACEVCPALATRRHAKGACIVCARLVCADCRVKRELCSLAPDGHLVEQRVAFCVPCQTIAARAAAADVASEEAARLANDETDHMLASLMSVASVSHDHDHSDRDLDRDSGLSSPRRGARRERGFGGEPDADEDFEERDDFVDGTDPVLQPRKSLQTSSAAGTLEADDDELDGARRARGASGLAPAYML